jgi:formylmethanofuran dehydrogenase subunit E
MFKKILGLFKVKKSYVSKDKEGNNIRNNPNNCFYCGEVIGSGRFTLRDGKLIHKRCVKKWILNKKVKTINGKRV